MSETPAINKILFLNIPHKTRVQRRYMCSYNTPSMLFPPIEMLYLASIAREWHHLKVDLLDAIAENAALESVVQYINHTNPDMIVTITGFEIFEEDAKIIQNLKHHFPNKKMVVFGHYSTNFPLETLIHTTADYILEGEPDINFSNLLDYLSSKISKDELQGVFYLDDNKNLVINKGTGRIKKPEELPLPAHDLLKIKHYNEPFLPKPFALIQSARGCPYACNFCVRSYGTRLALRSPESIIEEIKLLIEIHDIKSFRFIDDTFTATSKRVIRFCKLLVDSKIEIQWTCLSRADTLNEEMISWMKNAGCVRVYIGIESGSPKILKLINKEIDLDKGLENIRLLQKYMIQTTAFYMVGYPTETDEDFKMSLDYAIKANFDFVIPGRFIAYPGTKYYDDNKDQVDFNLFPYKNEFKDKGLIKTGITREKSFYRNYYFRFGYIGKIWKNLMVHPVEIFNNSLKAIHFQLPSNNKNVRNDYI